MNQGFLLNRGKHGNESIVTVDASFWKGCLDVISVVTKQCLNVIFVITIG